VALYTFDYIPTVDYQSPDLQSEYVAIQVAEKAEYKSPKISSHWHF
jgi:hypothetical protein